MEQLNAIEALTPYLNRCPFYAERYGIRRFCLCLTKQTSPVYGEVICINQDFFSGIEIIDNNWTADVDGNTIILHAPMESKIRIELIDSDTVIPQTVDWKSEFKLLNFVNKELWEEELVREISGITYYPIDLFRFKDRRTVLSSPQIKWLSKDLDIQWKRYTKTLYYYIKDNRLYIGLWNYELRMPENPIRLCEIDETYYRTMGE